MPCLQALRELCCTGCFNCHCRTFNCTLQKETFLKELGRQEDRQTFGSHPFRLWSAESPDTNARCVVCLRVASCMGGASTPARVAEDGGAGE